MIRLRSTDRLAYICTFDSAVDQEKSSLAEYKKTFDRKHLVLRDGETPTVFHLKRLTRGQIQLARSHGDDGAKMAEEAVAFGVERAENFPLELDTRQTGLGPRLTEQSLSPLVGSTELLFELANAVLTMSSIDPLG